MCRSLPNECIHVTAVRKHGRVCSVRRALASLACVARMQALAAQEAHLTEAWQAEMQRVQVRTLGEGPCLPLITKLLPHAPPPPAPLRAPLPVRA